MIRVRHLTLPAGLSAVVRRESDGGLQVFVSDALAADRQRAAVRLALRSIRRSGWRAGLLPVPIGVLLGPLWRRLVVISSPISRALRAHVVGAAATAFVVAAGAAALIVALPQHGGQATAGQQPGPGQVRAGSPGQTYKPGSGHHAGPEPRRTVAASTSPGARPGPVTTAHPASATPSASGSAAPKPSASTAGPQPGTPSPNPTAAPSPSSSPAAPTGVTCVVVLGVWVCL